MRASGVLACVDRGVAAGVVVVAFTSRVNACCLLCMWTQRAPSPRSPLKRHVHTDGRTRTHEHNTCTHSLPDISHSVSPSHSVSQSVSQSLTMNAHTPTHGSCGVILVDDKDRKIKDRSYNEKSCYIFASSNQVGGCGHPPFLLWCPSFCREHGVHAYCVRWHSQRYRWAEPAKSCVR